jgi:hypothetical protein
MASVSVVSPLSLDQQTHVLLEFVCARGHELTDTAAANICASLRLGRPSGSSTASRRIEDALAAHGIHITHTVALEALAKLCGGPNWMRARQQMVLALEGADQSAAAGETCYWLQPSRPDGVPMELVLKRSLKELGPELLALAKSMWQSEATPALCTVGAGQKLVSFELEHPTAPWVTFKIWSFPVSPGGKELELLALPAKEVHALVGYLERALEYAFPGLLVVGGIRSRHLGPHYVFTPGIVDTETDFRQECASPLDCFVYLGNCEGDIDEQPDGSFLVPWNGQHLRVEPRWMSQETGSFQPAPMAASQLQSLLNRMARCRRVTGLDITHVVAANVHSDQNLNDVHSLDLTKLQAAIERLGLSPADLAGKTELSLNSVLRLLKYGYAPVDVMPRIAAAVDFDDPNELLPAKGEQTVGVRVEDGAAFLRALKDTHMWRRIIGEGLRGQEAEEVNGIAESLQEYVELLQFSEGALREKVKFADGKGLEPVDETSLAIDVQELLDQLEARGVAVLMSRDVRFMRGRGEFAHMDKFPLHEGTLYFEKVSLLQRPPAAVA